MKKTQENKEHFSLYDDIALPLLFHLVFREKLPNLLLFNFRLPT